MTRIMAFKMKENKSNKIKDFIKTGRPIKQLNLFPMLSIILNFKMVMIGIATKTFNLNLGKSIIFTSLIIREIMRGFIQSKKKKISTTVRWKKKS